jgi:hypothetical protein
MTKKQTKLNKWITRSLVVVFLMQGFLGAGLGYYYGFEDGTQHQESLFAAREAFYKKVVDDLAEDNLQCRITNTDLIIKYGNLKM